MSAKPELIYWNGRGRAEIIRLLLAAGKVEFVEPYYMHDAPDFEKIKAEGVLKFNQLPLLKWDGMNLVQGGAIARYVANRCGMFGDNEKQRYGIDMLFEGTRDFITPLMGYNFGLFGTNEEIMKSIKTNLTKYMPVYEKQAVMFEGDFLVGDKLSLADVGLLEVLLIAEELVPDAFEEYPNLKKFLANIKNVPQIAGFLSGPQRKPPVNPTIVTEVSRTLGWAK